MDIFMNALIKMSLRGIVIVLVVLVVRFLLKKLQISHKYILGLWAMAFLYFIFPWKISLSVGFWNNAYVPEEVRVIAENPLGTNTNPETADNMMNIMHPSGTVNNYDGMPGDLAGNTGNMAADMDRAPDSAAASMSAELDGQHITGMNGTDDTDAVIATLPVGTNEQNMDEINETEKDGAGRLTVENIIGTIWLIGLCGLFGHMVYSYLMIKKKVSLSILYKDNIRWTEDIGFPMVFGLVHPGIYLPINIESENLTYVIAHEQMHIKRKDGFLKILAYVICLVHWFNPFIWIAYSMFGDDIEKACDEEVIQRMGKAKRKEYAYALLNMAAENGRRKRTIFVAPVCFDEGNVKSRIKNIMKYKYTMPGIGAVAVVIILALSLMFLTEAKGNTGDNVNTEDVGENSAGGDSEENTGSDIISGENIQDLPVFFVGDMDALQIDDDFVLEDYYITSRYTASNHYYIDDDGVLWGFGKNEFGQLGTGTRDYEESYGDPIRIAEHVVSVDASWNDYFCIYLTETGELYGIGSNQWGILLGRDSVSQVYSNYDFQVVTEPVLLMSDVAYARAGRECIVALRTDGTAYWWGQYAPTTHTYASGATDSYWSIHDSYWSVEEGSSNPVKMLATEPVMIMENCRYIATGDFTGAAISETGELYTWGFNIFGQCGTPVTEDDFVRTPVKVLDDVKMVWVDRIYFSDPMTEASEFARWETDYHFTTFVLKEDNTLLAVGVNLGNSEKVTEMTGDIIETQTYLYSDSFVPVQAVEYSIERNHRTVSELEFGMPIEKVEDILNGAGFDTLRSEEEYVRSEGYSVCVSTMYNQYFCYFDSQNQLVRITIQEGESRDGRFSEGMSFADLEKAVEESGGFLTKVDADTTYETWIYQDEEQQIRYEFTVYEGSVTVINEIAADGIAVDGSIKSIEPTAINPEQIEDLFGINILLPENTNWIVDSEYHLIDQNHLEITYYDAIIDSDCVILAARNENPILPEIEYDGTLNETWQGRTVNDQMITVNVQHEKNGGEAVLATWEYGEYQFAIIGEIEDGGDSGPIAKVALNIIYDLD